MARVLVPVSPSVKRARRPPHLDPFEQMLVAQTSLSHGRATQRHVDKLLSRLRLRHPQVRGTSWDPAKPAQRFLDEG